MPPSKTYLHLIVVVGEQASRGVPGEAMPFGVKAIGRKTSYAKWTGFQEP